MYAFPVFIDKSYILWNHGLVVEQVIVVEQLTNEGNYSKSKVWRVKSLEFTMLAMLCCQTMVY